MTTGSLSVRSASLKSRPAMSRNAQRREKSGRDGPEARARIFLARRADVAVGGELEARAEVARIAPRNRGADRDALHARQLRNAPDRFLVEAEDLVGRLAVRHHRHIDRQHVARVEAGLRRLQRQQRLQQHAGAGQQHEGRGDLRDREDPLPAAGAAA